MNVSVDKKREFIKYLHSHTDPHRPLTSTKIGRKLHMTGEAIRESVNHARAEGIPIGSGIHGYWWCDNNEVASTISHLKSRRVGINNALRGLADPWPRFSEARLRRAFPKRKKSHARR